MLEYDLWVQEMTITGLDFKNQVGIETFNCFKRVCIIERNTTKSSRSDPVQKEVQNTAVKKVTKSTYKVLQQEGDSSGSETEATIHAMSGPVPKLWNPPPELKFLCPLTIINMRLVPGLNFSVLVLWIDGKKLKKEGYLQI